MTMNEAMTAGIPDETDVALEELPHDAIAEVENGGDGGDPDGGESFKRVKNQALADGLRAATGATEVTVTDDAIVAKSTDLLTAQLTRHLAGGSSVLTLCGLPRTGLTVSHPSKAKKTDCLACRESLRESMKAKAPAIGANKIAGERNPISRGAKVAFEDGSAWLVEDVRDGGADVLCLVPSKRAGGIAGGGGTGYAKGRRITISRDAFVRGLDDEAFSELVASEKPAKAEGIVNLPPRGDAEGTATAIVLKAPRAGAWQATKADVAEVRRLRSLGRSYIAIEQEMSWPDGHGNRPWKLMKLTAEQIMSLPDGETKTTGEKPQETGA